MDKKAIQVLDDCLLWLAAGAAPGDCLKAYPQYAKELTPLLEAAAFLQATAAASPVPSEVKRRSRTRFLTSAGRLRASRATRQTGFVGLMQRLAFSALSVLVVLSLGTAGLVAAASPALPGDRLYGLKRAVENVQLAFDPSESGRAGVAARQNEMRLAEIQALLDASRVAEVSFGGLLTESTGEHWVVAGVSVHVASNTPIEGNPAPGLFVLVEGQTQPRESAVRASWIRVAGLLLAGTLESMSSTEWRVAGKAVLVGEETDLGGGLSVGDPVEASARRLDDGRLYALYIRPIAGTSEPTDEPSTPVATPQPTAESTSDGRPGRGHGRSTPSAAFPHNTTGSPFERVNFEGRVESFDASKWVVEGILVRVNGQTQIRGQPQLGDRVEVEGYRHPDGSILATEIALRGEDEAGNHQDGAEVDKGQGASTGDHGNKGEDIGKADGSGAGGNGKSRSGGRDERGHGKEDEPAGNGKNQGNDD